MFEVKAVDGVLRMETRETEASIDGTAVAGLEFQVGQRFERLRQAEVPGCGVSYHLIQLANHRGQAELVQLLMQ